MTGTPRTIATVRKNNFQELRIGLVTHAGCRLVDLRLYDLSKPKQGEPFPTKAGFCLALDRLPKLIEALKAAEREVSQ
ncbi:hypothetical protein MKK70_09995 [Methylobacterium sp. E-041]|uniref:hypothetical protein n=1 Tax=Methylobacterium sp. E-041 TaxID=2836573 RepID=UPI001FB86AB0|nr:hypothetical protein [Methylobacterium sp. E-041]MCJ2105698.1 hypothetical protein [Methylobacterium sp. E-041]